MESRLKAEGLKSRVINVIRVWEEWTIYPKEFLAKLKSVFLGKQVYKKFSAKELIINIFTLLYIQKLSYALFNRDKLVNNLKDRICSLYLN